jgi:hypothetical protein
LFSSNDEVLFFTTQKKFKSVYLNAAVIEEVQKTNQAIGIALHQSESLMLWTDWEKSSHIGVAFMDGSSTKMLVA